MKEIKLFDFIVSATSAGFESAPHNLVASGFAATWLL
jgi:hypothetical protein